MEHREAATFLVVQRWREIYSTKITYAGGDFKTYMDVYIFIVNVSITHAMAWSLIFFLQRGLRNFSQFQRRLHFVEGQKASLCRALRSPWRT